MVAEYIVMIYLSSQAAPSLATGYNPKTRMFLEAVSTMIQTASLL